MLSLLQLDETAKHHASDLPLALHVISYLIIVHD